MESFRNAEVHRDPYGGSPQFHQPFRSRGGIPNGSGSVRTVRRNAPLTRRYTADEDVRSWCVKSSANAEVHRSCCAQLGQVVQPFRQRGSIPEQEPRSGVFVLTVPPTRRYTGRAEHGLPAVHNRSACAEVRRSASRCDASCLKLFRSRGSTPTCLSRLAAKVILHRCGGTPHSPQPSDRSLSNRSANAEVHRIQRPTGTGKDNHSANGEVNRITPTTDTHH